MGGAVGNAKIFCRTENSLLENETLVSLSYVHCPISYWNPPHLACGMATGPATILIQPISPNFSLPLLQAELVMGVRVKGPVWPSFLIRGYLLPVWDLISRSHRKHSV